MVALVILLSKTVQIFGLKTFDLDFGLDNFVH